jgi:DNA polymerase III delta prime subunit
MEDQWFFENCTNVVDSLHYNEIHEQKKKGFNILKEKYDNFLNTYYKARPELNIFWLDSQSPY